MSTNSRNITAFIDVDRTGMICFRCGEIGHVRVQCLTYKVKRCYHHDNGGCLDTACTFAHGAEEMRNPWKLRCVRVVKNAGKFICIGCNSTEHTFRRCPLSQSFMLL